MNGPSPNFDLLYFFVPTVHHPSNSRQPHPHRHIQQNKIIAYGLVTHKLYPPNQSRSPVPDEALHSASFEYVLSPQPHRTGPQSLTDQPMSKKQKQNIHESTQQSKIYPCQYSTRLNPPHLTTLRTKR